MRAWGDVVRLGQTIVTELGLQDSNDTLGRWMSHRLAELMKRAASTKSKTERETAQAEASDLIIALWEHRAGWPQGWPPKATAALTRDRNPYVRQEESTGSPWLDSLSELDRLHAREREVWMDLGLLDFDVESERRAAKELIGEESKEEREAIELVIRLWESAEADLRKSLGEEITSPQARGKAGVERLTVIDSERRKLRKHTQALHSETEEAE
ncbi:MAG: hypothetical protein Q8S43_06800 [Actinomycetota bacterium]|nr:hypothetical protein [Actinomycetota bacterium]